MDCASFSPINTWKTEEGNVSLFFKEGSPFKEGIRLEMTSKKKTEQVALNNILAWPSSIEDQGSTKRWSIQEISNLFAKCYPKVNRNRIEFVENCFAGMKVTVQLAKGTSTTTLRLGNETISMSLGEDIQNTDLTLEVDPIDTISQVELKIRANVEIPANKEIILAYQGTVLEGSKTLISYDITDDSLLVECEEEGRSGSNKSFEFNDCSKAKESQFSDKAPTWRILTRGLNLLGKCENPGCKANKQYVWIQKGFNDKFQIGREKYTSKCPAGTDGHLATKVDNLAFWDCHYEIDGFRTKPKEEPFNSKGTAPKEKYITFEQGGNLAEWAFLDIKTTRK